MVNKNTIIAIILIVIALGLILLGVFMALNGSINEDTSEFADKLYVVEFNGKYGVMNAKGKIIAQAAFDKIGRVNDTLYLKSETSSLLYDLKTNKTIDLEGLETNFSYVKGQDGFEDKYILSYGESDANSIYRIIDSEGKRVSDNDFSSISAAYKYLNIVNADNFVPLDSKNSSIGSYNVKSTLSYPTVDGKTQYIVSNSDSTSINNKYGIVDENNKQIVELTFDSIEQVKDSSRACLAKRGDSHYVILYNGTIIETEEGFEFDYVEDSYIVQKRGQTANKIYNLDGDVVIDQIFTYPAKIVTLNAASTKYLLMLNEKTQIWHMYDLNTTKKIDTTFSNLIVDYLYDKDPNVINTSLIYKTNALIGVDIETFRTFQIKIENNVIAPLESGLILSVSDTQTTN
ncbi:MAG: WG repeat-containing protein [Clostridia bacterium]|nr:WG repeat-containing protein [Clostridia bacterium]